jgi:hypothetical protein
MTQRRRPCRFVTAWMFQALGSVAWMCAGCQADAPREVLKDPPVVQAASAPRLFYEPELDVFYASIQNASEDPQLEPGFSLLLYDRDLNGALDHFLKMPADGPEQRLSRAVGAGRSALILSRWFTLLAQFMAEADLGYIRDLDESASHGHSRPASEVERFVAGRSALYLNWRQEALRQLEAVKAPEAAAWKAAAAGSAALDKDLPRPPVEAVLAKAGPDAAVETLRAMDWKTPTDGVLWDPYAFAAAAHVYLELSRVRFEEAAMLGAELAQKLEPNVLEGIRYHLAQSCFLAGRAECVAGLGPGEPGRPLAMLVRASADRAQGKKTELAELAPAPSSLQSGLLAAQLADGSPLEERIQTAEQAIEWGSAHLASSNRVLWPDVFQGSLRIPAMLRQRQAEETGDLGGKQDKLSAGIARLRDAQLDLQEPLAVMQFALLSLQRSGCLDFAFAKRLLAEKLAEHHEELYGPIWVSSGSYGKNCTDVITGTRG